MRHQILSARCVAWSGRLIAPLFIPIILLASNVLLLPSVAFGDRVAAPTAGPEPFGDDVHTSTLNPYPAIAVSTIASNPPGQCAWINTGLNNFIAVNQPDGTDGMGHASQSGQGWSYSWAGAAAEAKVEAGISFFSPYQAYVITQPTVTAANGNVYAGAGPGEYGGAVMNLQYTTQPGAPAINNLHWIQGLTGSLWGTTIPTGLDNFTSLTTYSRDNSSPFYDGGLTPGTAGRLGGGGGWFLDTPLINELNPNTGREYETNPIASVQFQVVLASDTTSVVNGVTQNALTLYGGEWWGFNYSATDVPEPSTLVLLALGGMGFLMFRRMKGKKSAE